MPVHVGKIPFTIQTRS